MEFEFSEFLYTFFQIEKVLYKFDIFRLQNCCENRENIVFKNLTVSVVLHKKAMKDFVKSL